MHFPQLSAHRVIWRVTVSLFFFISLSEAAVTKAQRPSLSFYSERPRSGETVPVGKPQLVFFDRMKNEARDATKTIVPLDDSSKWAIGSSNSLLSGTLVVVRGVAGCWTYDWNATALGEETSNIIVYRPGDASVYCNAPAVTPPDVNQTADLYVVLPVKVIWVQVTGFPGDLNDPARKTPAAISPGPYCWDSIKTAPTRLPLDGLKPCDREETWLRRRYYHSGWLYNRLTEPGEWAGSFSIAPQVVQKASQTLTEDIRFYGSSQAGPGWLGVNVAFEKGASVASNLNSLTGALTYDFRLSHENCWGCSQEERVQPFVVRPGEFVISSGEEYADTRAKRSDGFHYPKDLNLVEAIYYKQPISITAFSFPSFLTLFPVVGAEGGWHIIRYEGDESAQLFRKVAGIDASIRYPFQGAPNFTSIKGATLDYSLRERFLTGNEPYTDTHPLSTTGMLLPVMPGLSRQRRSYSRIALTWPFSTYVALNATVQRGSLPPDFPSVAWTLTLGLAIASTGTAEH